MKIQQSLFVLLLVISVTGIALVAGCKKDTTNSSLCATACGGNTTCDSATHACICATSSGYEGTNCTTEQRAKFFGSFDGTPQCSQGSNSPRTMSITTSTGSVKNIDIHDLYSTYLLTGTVSGNDITIPSQNAGGTAVAGTGTLSTDGHTLTINYSQSIAGYSITCTFVGTKQ